MDGRGTGKNVQEMKTENTANITDRWWLIPSLSTAPIAFPLPRWTFGFIPSTSWKGEYCWGRALCTQGIWPYRRQKFRNLGSVNLLLCVKNSFSVLVTSWEIDCNLCKDFVCDVVSQFQLPTSFCSFKKNYNYIGFSLQSIIPIIKEYVAVCK